MFPFAFFAIGEHWADIIKLLTTVCNHMQCTIGLVFFNWEIIVFKPGKQTDVGLQYGQDV